jgi:HSP20 family protein
MTAVVRRRPASPWTDIWEWLEAGLPLDLRHEGANVIRVEERAEEGRYVVRAEIPGIDPDKDVSIVLTDGLLTITAERREEVSEKHRSEFHYGQFVRRLALPAGAQEDQVTARYTDGILEVTVPLAGPRTQGRTIPVSREPAD